ncbi:MAG: NTP transferase domain-containing protein [bacterium]
MDWIHILLAAGRSSRMGTPKQLLETPAGENFISNWCEVARQAGALKSYVVLGFHSARVKYCLEPFADNIELVVNPNPAADQTSSMKTALKTTGFDHPALMTLVDQPPLPRAVLEKILPSSTSGREKIRIPVFKSRRGHPPWFPTWFLKEIYNLGNDCGINSLYSQYSEKIQTVKSDCSLVLKDIDRPADYQKYYERG